MDNEFNDNIDELPRCVYPVDGKLCGVYVPKGEDLCREHSYLEIGSPGYILKPIDFFPKLYNPNGTEMRWWED